MAVLEEQILQCLLLDGRMPLRRIADVVGASEQTVARRYRTMRDAGHLRVAIVRSNFSALRRAWYVRIRCRPDFADALAGALADREDTAWIAVAAGGSEVVCATSGPVGSEGEGVLRHLPHTRAVLSFSAQAMLRPFGTARDGWTMFDTPLSTRSAHELTPVRPTGGVVRIGSDDEPLLTALARDGRMSVAALTRELGWPSSRVSGRLDALLAGGELYLLTDFLPEAFGLQHAAVLQLTVAPRHLLAVGRALASHRPTSFVTATSGSANLLAEVTCRTSEELFDYLTGQVGELPGVNGVDLVPYSRRVKQAAATVVHGRLVEPRAGSNPAGRHST